MLCFVLIAYMLGCVVLCVDSNSRDGEATQEQESRVQFWVALLAGKYITSGVIRGAGSEIMMNEGRNLALHLAVLDSESWKQFEIKLEVCSWSFQGICKGRVKFFQRQLFQKAWHKLSHGGELGTAVDQACEILERFSSFDLTFQDSGCLVSCTWCLVSKRSPGTWLLPQHQKRDLIAPNWIPRFSVSGFAFL